MPELTDYGAHRCYGKFENTSFDCLFPSPQDRAEGEPSIGQRFFSREKFIELIIYAGERNIQIVPEIDLPAHARAAVKCKFFFTKLHLKNVYLGGVYVLQLQFINLE